METSSLLSLFDLDAPCTRQLVPDLFGDGECRHAQMKRTLVDDPKFPDVSSFVNGQVIFVDGGMTAVV